MFQTLAHLHYPTHNVHVSQHDETLTICCFKYNDSQCDQQVFPSDDLDTVSQYMIQPLQTSGWRFVEDTEE